MRTPFMTLLIIALLAAGGYAVYRTMTTPRPLEDRMDSAAEDLGNGNLGNAVDDLKNRTPADQVSDTVHDAIDRAQQ